MKEVKKEVKKAVKFFNWTDEDFSHTYNGEMYTFLKGETTMLPEGIANHFAKHAAVRELNKASIVTDAQYLPPMIAKFLIASDVKAESDEKLEVTLMNENKFCNSCDSKGVRHKKECTLKVSEESEESTFEGLKK